MVIGELTLNEEKYHFEFSNYELQIYRFESDEAKHDDFVDLLSHKPVNLPDKIIGICYPDNHKICFMQISMIGVSNNVKRLSVKSYFEINNAYSFPQLISQIAVCADELNSIYPPSLMYSQSRNETGSITAINIEQPRQSYHWEFRRDGHTITASSGFFHTYRFDSTPVQIQSVLYFSFDSTDNYQYIVDLFDILHRLLQYLCYRQNIHVTGAYIYATDESGEQIRIGTFAASWISELQPETDKRVFRKVISFDLISNSIGNLLQRLADKTLYCRHLPNSSLDERRITPARSIMLAAAFEWEHSREYLGGRTQNKGPFRQRMIQVFKDYSECIGVFANNKYARNNKKYSISAAAEKITKARNGFAHGDIKDTYDLETLLGISILPYLIYAMQLRAAGLDDLLIKKSINQLFALQISV